MDLLRSLPLGLYLEQPVTWLHRLDSRVKFLWLMSFLVVPVLANSPTRIALVVLLVILTLSAMIPLRVWRQQMGWLLLLMTMVFVLTAIAPDGLAATHQPRLPKDELALTQQVTLPPPAIRRPWYNPLGLGEPSASPAASPTVELPQPMDYRYILLKQPPFTVTRRSLDLSIRISTLIFTLIYSTNLYLLTTAPEEITEGLDSLMRPLQRYIPVTEIVLTLTLALRFIPLVLEEVQNLVRSIQTRAINWRKLGFRGASQIWLMVAERLLENLLRRAEQIASAMLIRGFTTPNQHRVQWHPLLMQRQDWVAIGALFCLWGLRLVWGGQP